MEEVVAEEIPAQSPDAIPSDDVPGEGAGSSSEPVRSSASKPMSTSDRFRAAPGAHSLDGDKCPKCKKMVGHGAEKLLAANAVWHKTCFTCGGSGSEGCGRVLKIDNFHKLGKTVFCKACHAKLEEKKKLASGGGIAASAQDKVGSADRVAEVLAHTKTHSVSQRASIFAKSPSSPMSPAGGATGPSPGSDGRRASVALKLGSSLGEKCKSCEKTVYTAEKILAQGYSWHKTCFKCGDSSGQGCGKVLQSGGYEENGGVAYCKSCSSKLFNNSKHKLSLASGWTGPASPTPAKSPVSPRPEASAVSSAIFGGNR